MTQLLLLLGMIKRLQNLTTIRNSVGVAGSKYENYGVVYILSDNILSSIITACQDLQSLGGPLHSSYVIRNIQEKAEERITKDLERSYLTKHLEKVSDYIADGTCDLFDFKYALNVLVDGTLKGHYNELDFFSDKAVYDVSFKPSDYEMQFRIDKNHEIFRKVSDIMNEDDDTDKQKLLQKILDEKLSTKIVKDKFWRNIDFQEFLYSIERKAATANLELIGIELPSEGLMTSLVKNTNGNPKKKSKSYIIICDQTESPKEQVEVTFNKQLKNMSSETCKTKGKKLNVSVGDTLVRQSVGLNDNHHDFFMMKLPCSNSFFKEIHQSFSINKKGEIVVDVPEGTDVLSFGTGSNIMSLPLDNRVVWTESTKLEIPIDVDDDNICFEVDFGSKQINVNLKLYTAKPIPPARPGTVEGTYVGGEVIVEDKPRAVYSFWKKYLDWEYSFIKHGCAHINHYYNELANEYEPEYEVLDLPGNIQKTLIRLYDYYNEHETIPSLCHMNEELRGLYREYWKSVVDTIQSIPNSRCLTREEYLITKLGVVIEGGRVYLSPFHPILVSYALEYDCQFDAKEDSSFAKKLLSPFYLLPYIFVNNCALRPYTDKKLSGIDNWLSYESVNSKPQERTNDITTKMVWTKMQAFIRHFKYLFQDKDCPIIISTVGIADDTNVIKGLLEFIRREYASGVQRIELHEYVDDLMNETFFEKLNRLDSMDSILREMESLNVKIESKGEYTSQEIIHQLFTRVSFYKQTIATANDNINYSHIAFYQMNTMIVFRAL